MPARWQRYLDRWTNAGLIDPVTAERIRALEAREERAGGLRWPVLLAVSLGGLLLAAGVLLFVAAHWDRLSPGERFGLVLGLVAVFHLGAAALAQGFPALATTLHAVGTVCLGAGIFLAGQIFHLQEHWPAGIMAWALGAGIGWALLRDWPQAALAALLTPAWLGGEWLEAVGDQEVSIRILVEGLLLLAITYLTALQPDRTTPVRRALMVIGALTLLPLATAVPLIAAEVPRSAPAWEGPAGLGRTLAVALPLLAAFGLRRRAAWLNGVAALWVLALGQTRWTMGSGWQDLGPYALWALGGLALIAWGLAEEHRERINLGVAGFALTVIAYYFSTVMDKLGRASSLIGLGLLFVLGGWLLEKVRRRLLARVGRVQP
ncbi:MAG: DUF2157 domain-containing protein [Thermodesulfobacteriota bacterium]